jgi:hypothetical protein
MIDEIFDKMSRIANRYVKAWITDFTHYDAPKYANSMNGTEFIWIVRPCGTHFFNVPKQFQMIFGPMTDEDKEKEKGFIRDTVNYYNEDDNRFYHIIKGKSIKKVSKQFCLRLLK